MNKMLYCIFAYTLFLFTITSFQISPPLSSNKSFKNDQTALLALKSHIISHSHSSQLIFSRNWTNSSSVCSWHGVSCSSKHHRVTALNLSYMSLSGTIPPQLGLLSFLVSLDLKSNFFRGTLPPELVSLHRLKFISLRLNNFTGDIPRFLGQLPNLETLSLRNNSFTGSIPKSLSNLTKLHVLDLTSNSLSGEIPQELGRLQNLQFLGIEFNRLAGDIPSSIFNISSLEYVAFSYNYELSGTLPTDMCMGDHTLPFLAGIFLSHNQLTGIIPTNLSQCSRLEILSLSFNSFSGEIPPQIGYLASLQKLALGGNNLNGVVPHEIGFLQNLIIFGVEINEIEGSVDWNIFMNMSSLQSLSLARNKLIGELSPDVGNLTMLASLNLAENLFTGVIPREIGQLYQLQELILETNKLRGLVPLELFNISSLETLALSDNALSGVLPRHVCHASPTLEYLYLGLNSFTGPIPSSISNCSQLRILILDSNKFTGYIPNNLGNLRFLQSLHLSNNSLSNAPWSPSELSFLTSLTDCRFLTVVSFDSNPLHGAIPPSVGNLSSSLRQIAAYGCKLSGSIPVEIGNLSSLIRLHLYDNELSGNIPLSVKHLHELQGLFLDGNMFEGFIPEAICDLHSLNTVYLSRNRFSGPIPQCLGNVSSLREIYLDSNMLSSGIPSSLWGLKDLMMLDLSNNSLSGCLPQEISNLGAAIFINLSMNQLSEAIPQSVGMLQNLVNLSLADNRLEGSIPLSVGNMISLVTLDLSCNNLSGSIPESLEGLKYLDYLNLSFNDLRGEIPSGGSFRNLSTSSFEGNEGLCGNPMFHVRTCPAVSKRKNLMEVKVALFVGLGVVALVTLVCLAFIRNKRKDTSTREVAHEMTMISIVPERISYYELVEATQEFNESNLIGTGSCCSVYRGVLRSSGRAIAVKVFNAQLESISVRFEVECEVLRSIRHRNLTSVISSCSNGEFKALVLEYMPNGSLEKWLYSHNYFLNVMERLSIMVDVASALEYLHYGCPTPIVHSDLKPSNVLLDEDMVGHVSDFGMSKLLGDGDSFVVTNTLATLGYIAPEYGGEGLVSTRCDVYSYGVMLIETFTRKRPSDDMFGGDLSLKKWVEISLPKCVDEVIDANLLVAEEREQKMQCINCILELGLKCCAESPGDRINIKQALTELLDVKRRFSTNLRH